MPRGSPFRGAKRAISCFVVYIKAKKFWTRGSHDLEKKNCTKFLTSEYFTLFIININTRMRFCGKPVNTIFRKYF